ncbi:NAD(P)/FAD-dependent oxidoreductase [Bordetella petrii]|uniref:NAD(P)/FAD-dependent oxidoreductase n=1 Tax=Bordetella petrii TaxID=94624 RepID=UPI001E58119B|nr:FAD-binding oxidoreductase [Bordetella petrii]MCD0501670.1 FAD-binding oxidoreductase [Bordetella petrii]
MNTYDVVVIGAGVMGSSVAFHLARLGTANVLLLDRGTIGAGTTAQSSGILRTHYSIRENADLARHSWQIFSRFTDYLGDDDASCGLVKCGYLIAAPEGDKLDALRATLQQQREQGIAVETLDPPQARRLLPIAQFDDAALIGYEPEAGFADAYMTAASFARAARRAGVTVREHVQVENLLIDRGRVTGVSTSTGDFHAATVISTQNVWTPELATWTGHGLPLAPERHAVLALECQAARYAYSMPVFKDLASPGMLYCRSYGGSQMMVAEGVAGEKLDTLELEQGDVSMDYIADIGGQVAARFPAYEAAGIASSWTGVYDVTPDWNPVLGRLPGIEGLVVGYGFSGHGFKLSPMVGRILAQEALGLPTDVSLAPYSIQRFSTGALLAGRYGAGAVS